MAVVVCLVGCWQVNIVSCQSQSQAVSEALKTACTLGFIYFFTFLFWGKHSHLTAATNLMSVIFLLLSEDKEDKSEKSVKIKKTRVRKDLVKWK